LLCLPENRTRSESGQRFLASNDPVQRLPEKATRAMPLGASGMYQRKPALERPMVRFLRFL
jgi:hypothetical protein